ncbi:hypothetical protein H1S01_03120 [Heliobacterium chlorum]|uniref:Uncharacterized protein n=1 Tax=Heliobacterium chlorum TaxID=2698 RepID=A0ABR7T079_HELCL|nr:hypothetical protein [Heliobacterium chlorum]MBC9783502.1 hypothetical protein [Heliobacterium chlorum]
MSIAAEQEKKVLRPSVEWFADRMEIVLKRNDYKGGWEGCQPDFLVDKLLEEVSEVIGLLCVTPEKKVAINAMMTGVRAMVGQSVYKSWGAAEHRGLNKPYLINEATDVANMSMMIADNAKNLIDSV